ncbi:uncharacterized protein LOC130899995 [Diorhabda carinulata]|uniref:uncharacterized protein LOC130899995 n=1 Tax=Diorhabda carinulata TaxID=1163345 RepID=UPI0025A016DB|nr:uncharacterized protein LOC130899995 [Diorhabda carinulata]
MICFLIYIPFSEFCIANNRCSTTSTDLVLSKENKKLLFNPDCYVGVLLDYICHTVGVPKEEQENIDLLDDKLNFLNISMYPPNAEGIEIFNNRMTYYLAYRIDKVFQPLLAVDSHESDEFLNSTKRRSKRRSSLSATSKNSKNAIKNSLHTLPELSISTKRSPN